MEFARVNMKANIFEQTVLEWIAAFFPQMEEIIENGIVNGISATDVLQSEMNYYILCHIAKIVNEGFFMA